MWQSSRATSRTVLTSPTLPGVRWTCLCSSRTNSLSWMVSALCSRAVRLRAAYTRSSVSRKKRLTASRGLAAQGSPHRAAVPRRVLARWLSTQGQLLSTGKVLRERHLRRESRESRTRHQINQGHLCRQRRAQCSKARRLAVVLPPSLPPVMYMKQRNATISF